MQRDRYGAYPGDWDWWVRQGLGQDLVPIVSAPGCRFYADSKLKGLGKVPSRFTVRDEVVGFKGWTSHYASQKDIAAWKGDPRLGLGVIGRHVKAIDADVNDQAVIDAIERLIFDLTGEILPKRFRRNSAKVLFMFRCSDFLDKRMVRWVGNDRQLIEFLGNKQQFVVAGAHWSGEPNEPSGARYEWEGGLPKTIPVLTKEQALEVWAAIVERFGAPGTAAGGRNDTERLNVERIETSDAVAEFLQESNLVLSADDDKLHIDCPWKDGHSMDSGVSQTSWLIAGSGGFQQGHFECRHGSCQKRTDQEFLEAIGYLAFTALPPIEDENREKLVAEGVSDPMLLEVFSAAPPTFETRLVDKKPKKLSHLANLVEALRCASMIGYWLRFDDALGVETLTDKTGRTVKIEEAEQTAIAYTLERYHGFMPISVETLRRALYLASLKDRYDSYIEWARGLEWDGVPRVERFLIDYLGCADTPYHRAVGLYWWTALAGRLLEPGIQADMVPVILGAQGIGKTQLLKAIAPLPDTYREADMGARDADTSRVILGALVVELAEMRGLRTRGNESIKAWVTRQREVWVPKFKEQARSYARRCLFIGTTNDDELLDDATGERRWLPFEAPKVDLAAVKRDMLQLWAEAVWLFDMAGIAWEDAQRLAPEVHDNFKVIDAWEEPVRRWLDGQPDLTQTTTTQVAVLALNLEEREVNQTVQQRIGKILHKCGFLRDQVRRNGQKVRVFRRFASPASPGEN